jgi:uncharacterized YigZ family protein
VTALHTLTGRASLQQEIRKSRFLAQAASVDDPDAAMATMAELADPLATHNCWAYRIGTAYRFSDDGEPGGTAGRPILQAIESQGFDRIVVVVTRWYGGTKLGAGGLARAYGGSAAECLRLAPRAEIVDTENMNVRIEFGLLPIVQARLADFAAESISAEFDADGVSLTLRVPRARTEQLARFLRDLSKGQADVRLQAD